MIMLTRSVKLTIIGAVVGAVLGGTAAWAIARAQEARLSPEQRSGLELSLQTDIKAYVALAMTLAAVVRSVADLFRLKDMQTERLVQD
jgi:membrane protein YqaA with SNARE-associated domain